MVSAIPQFLRFENPEMTVPFVTVLTCFFRNFLSHCLAGDAFVNIIILPEQIPTNILKDCKALQNFSLHGNPISMDQFQEVSCQNSLVLSSFFIITFLLPISFMFVSKLYLKFFQMEGFQEFEARRRKKFDKQIDSNVMISSKGLDEGVDLWELHLWNYCKF